MRQARLAWVWMLAVPAVLGCNQAKFSGEAKRQAAEPPPAPETSSFSMTCAEGQAGFHADVKLKAGVKTTTSLAGEFCPTAPSAATVLFVVDYSGSMGKHRPTSNADVIPGNDPETTGTCGRLGAAQAVMSQLAATGGADVQVGFVPFAGAVLEDRQLALRPLADFQGSVTKETFCSYVVQSASFGYDPANAGGIDGGNVNSSTNYASAFSAAETMLTGVQGHKVVYFISDGEPTSGGSDPAAAGIAAGKDLRDHVPDLTLNGLLLGADGAKAQDVLQQVVGDGNQVRVAVKADELAKEIVQFQDQDLSDATAELVIGTAVGVQLGLKSLTKNAAAGTWSFETNQFELNVDSGKTVEHKLTIAAKSSTGATVSATADLSVTRM